MIEVGRESAGAIAAANGQSVAVKMPGSERAHVVIDSEHLQYLCGADQLQTLI